MTAGNYSDNMKNLISTVFFFGLSKGIAQKVWQDSSLCRLSTTTQIKTSTKIS